jgi:hypothetical protein
MFFEDGLEMLFWWVIGLTILELLIDVSCMISSSRWFFSGSTRTSTLTWRLGAAAAILHAIRVLIYVLGKIGPWYDFDVKPIYRASYTAEWVWVWFAAALAVLGLIGVIVIWRLRNRARLSNL